MFSLQIAEAIFTVKMDGQFLQNVLPGLGLGAS
jgi:hypothetical protein